MRICDVKKDVMAAMNTKLQARLSEAYEKVFDGRRILETRPYTMKDQRTHLVHGHSRGIVFADAPNEVTYIKEHLAYVMRGHFNCESVKNTKTGQLGSLRNPKYDCAFLSFIQLAEGLLHCFKYPWISDWFAHNAHNYDEQRSLNPGYDTVIVKVNPSHLLSDARGHCKTVRFERFTALELSRMRGNEAKIGVLDQLIDDMFGHTPEHA